MQAEGIDHVGDALMILMTMDVEIEDVVAVGDRDQEIQATVMIAVSAKIASIEAKEPTDAIRQKVVAQKRAMTKLKQSEKMRQHLKRI